MKVAYRRYTMIENIAFPYAVSWYDEDYCITRLQERRTNICPIEIVQSFRIIIRNFSELAYYILESTIVFVLRYAILFGVDFELRGDPELSHPPNWEQEFDEKVKFFGSPTDCFLFSETYLTPHRIWKRFIERGVKFYPVLMKQILIRVAARGPCQRA